MKNFALLLLFAILLASFGDADDETVGEKSMRVQLEGSEKVRDSDLGKDQRIEYGKSWEGFKGTFGREQNIKQTAVKKTVDEPTGLPADEGEERVVLDELRERFVRSFERIEGSAAPKISNFYRKSDDVSERTSSSSVPNMGIPMDLNLQQVKDLLEGAMGYGCDDGPKELSAWAEMERELLQYCGYGKVHCMPEKVRFRGKSGDIANEQCCHPQQSVKERKDRNLQIFDDMTNEMFGLPCGGGRDGMAARPVMYCGYGKIRRVRRKNRKHCEGCDVPSKTACCPLPRLYQPSDMDLQLVNQIMDEIMGVPFKYRKVPEKKPNEIDMKLLRFCGYGKIHRMPDPSSDSCLASIAFNKSSCNDGQNVQSPADLDFEEVNNLMKEVMKFAGRKEEEVVASQDLQDWLYGYCGFGKLTRVSVDSFPHRRAIDTFQKSKCNPLESPEEPKKKVLNQMDLYLDDLLGYNCKEEEEEEEEMGTYEEISVLRQFCGFGKIRFLPENYFLDHSTRNMSTPVSCGTQEGVGDLMDLSLYQVTELLEDMMGLPKGGVIAAIGGGMYLICAVTKLHVLPEPFVVHQSSSVVSNGENFSPLPGK